MNCLGTKDGGQFMLFIDHPHMLPHIAELPYGYQPAQFPDGRYCLIIKANKEIILTARVNNSFKIYLIPDAKTPGRALGFMSAFFDDHDEPLVLFTPLYADDEMLHDLGGSLSQYMFDLYFFDENSHELMGVSAHLADTERFRQTLSSFTFPAFDQNKLHATNAAMSDWFGLRDASDDALAFEVRLGERLYPDDLMIIDARDEAYDFQGSEGQVMLTSLEREEPGAFQERDIIALLRRCFLGDRVFLNPVREDTGKELCDILVVSENVVLLIQAKDSPNTEASLGRSINRKKTTIRGHVEKAARQLSGAIGHVLGRDSIVLQTPSGPGFVDIDDRSVFGLVVVRELFDDDFKPCSAPVLAVAQETGLPCVLVDYAALHTMTLYLSSEERFVGGFLQMFEVGSKFGEFPKPRFTGKPSDGAAGIADKQTLT
jgi:hypothetical protein